MTRFLVKLNVVEYKSIIARGFACMMHVHAATVNVQFGKIRAVRARTLRACAIVRER